MALGMLFGGWRIVRTMGPRITRLSPTQAVCAETACAIALFLATGMGVPVSTTHTITGAIFGLARRGILSSRGLLWSDVTLGVRAQPVINQGRQVAALCWRLAPTLEVLLVTSLRTRRWILPKGWPMRGMSSAQSAALEALEEAGVAGYIADLPIGRYHYLKEKKGRSFPCNVDVFPLQVRHLLKTWPEKGTREMVWLPVSEAARRIAEPELRHILLTFYKGRAAA